MLLFRMNNLEDQLPPKRKNIYWINAAKALAIIAVYLTHVQASTFYGYSIGRVHEIIEP